MPKPVGDAELEAIQRVGLDPLLLGGVEAGSTSRSIGVFVASCLSSSTGLNAR